MWFLALCILAAVATAPVAAVDYCSPICNCTDICIMVDTSKSINQEDWNDQVEFFNNFVDELINRNIDARIAAVNFSKNASLVFNLNTYANLINTKIGFSTIIPQRKNTQHSKALQICLDQVFIGSSSGDRDDDDCPDLAIMITDGLNNSGGDAVSIANQLKNDGVTIVGVVVGLLEIDLIEDIASPNLIFNVSNHKQLANKVEELLDFICGIRGDPDTQTCCCGCLHGTSEYPKPDNQYNCCKGVAYRFLDDTCCDGVINYGKPEKSHRCCGTVAFNPENEKCCGSTVVSYSAGETQCCDVEVYNPLTHICCETGSDSQIHLLSSGDQCCGTDYIDTEKYTCCNKVKHEGNQCETRCCGDTPYDSREYDCCDASTGEIVERLNKKEGIAENIYCNSLEKYDPLWDSCCCGKKYPGTPVNSNSSCCEDVLHDFWQGICCQGVFRVGHPLTYECCGTQRFNPTKQTCCCEKVYNGLGPCCGDVGIFDPATQICCEDKLIVTGNPRYMACCVASDGSVRGYNVKTQLCCDGEVLSGGDYWSCCADERFDTLWVNCCHEELVNRTEFKDYGICDFAPTA